MRLVVALGFILAVLLMLFVPLEKSLVFYKENSDVVLAYVPVDAGDRFNLIFTHSIHLTDVVELFEVTADGDLLALEMVYAEFGIGMPSNSGVGERFEYKDGKYHIKDINQVHESLKIRNGKTVSKNRVVWGADLMNEVYLNELMEPGVWFTLRVDRLSVWDLMKGGRIGAG